MTEPVASIIVDGEAVEARPGELLIAACERSGAYIPRFCYHRRMESVGMCRMCLVEVDTGRGPSLQPSCMVGVSDGMKVWTRSEKAKKAQDGVLEFLLINHPLDCPVCDKGGECPLQDQTMAYGPGESRFSEEKRHFEKPIAISDTVYLDRERCILCDRCTRFADQVAGDPLIYFMGRGGHTEVNTFGDEPFSSYFSGNTVQICPVGALTAVPYRFKARPWDLTESLSTAWVDSVGARVSVQASRNRVLRVLGADADAVNWGWLSDKERFGFEALNSRSRLRAPAGRTSRAAEFTRLGWSQALRQVAGALTEAEPRCIGVVGGARLTNEAQYAWAKLVKGVIGSDNFDAQLGDGLDAGLVLGLPRATIEEACRPGSVVVLAGPDPKEELGTLYLRLRHAAVKDAVTLIEVQPCDGGLTGLAAHRLRPRPGETAEVARRLVQAVKACDDASAADPDSSDNPDGSADADNPADAQAPACGDPAGGAAAAQQPAITAAAQAIAAAQGNLTVVMGRPSLAEHGRVADDTARALSELPSARFLPALRRGNIGGALEAGLSPGLLPGRKRLEDLEGFAGADPRDAEITGALAAAWPSVPPEVGLDATGILRAAAAGDIDVLVLLGADPLNDFTDRQLAERGLLGARYVVAVDMFVNDSSALAADVVLAAAGPTECEGTFTNLEGRVSPMSQKVTPAGTARPDWMIAAALAGRLDDERRQDLNFETASDIAAEMSRVSAPHRCATPDAVAAQPIEGVLLESSTSDGILVRGVTAPAASGGSRTAEPSQVRTSGLRLIATRSMYDDGVMLRHCPSSRGLASPAVARIHPSELAALRLSHGDKVRVSVDRRSLNAVLEADDGVPAGCVSVNWLAPAAPANALIAAGSTFTEASVTAR